MIDLTDDEAAAAEYVLGTLDAQEREAAENRRVHDPAFDLLIAQWEARLAPLAAATRAIAPSPDLLDRLMGKIAEDTRVDPSAPAYANDNIIMVRSRLRVWRAAAVAASAIAAALALWIVGHDLLPGAGPDKTYVAVLQHGADQPSFVVSLDLANRRMAVIPLDTTAPAGKSYELWMIGGDAAKPRSMGVIDAAAPLHPHLPDVSPAVLSNATYAVTVEAPGGSPTGQPTSTPVFVGKPVSTAL